VADRFPTRPERPREERANGGGGNDLLGEWWAAIAILGLAALAMLGLTAGGERKQGGPPDPAPSLLAALAPAERDLAAIESAFASLCAEPLLVAVELAPDCSTGAITLGDDLFDGFMGTEIRKDVREEVIAAMGTWLARLRALPALWERLEAIEIRGHTDPRAVRDPYTTNLVGSQQRALGVLLELVGPNGLTEDDRALLERLATVSGASFSRPPASCPERSRECYRAWRRVEIRPVLSEPQRRADWARTVDELRAITQSHQKAMVAGGDPTR